MMPLRRRPDLTSSTGLTPAERVRAILASASTLTVGIFNLTSEVPRHAVTGDGDLLLLPPADSPERVFAVARNLPAQTVHVQAIDIGPVPHHDRVRGVVNLTGTLAPFSGQLPAGVREHLIGPMGGDAQLPVLAFSPQRISLDWRCEDLPVSEVAADDYRLAFPDALLPHEADWLTHLQRDHDDAIAALAAYAAADWPGACARPLSLDRYGIVLRLLWQEQQRDVRLSFEHPLACGCDLNQAFGVLMDRLPHGAPGLDCC